MKAVVFGAGNIGRGFLGLQLYKSGCNTVFIDTDVEKIESINNRKEYPVIIVSSEKREEVTVKNVSGIMANDTEAVRGAIADAEIVLTAVGKRALPYVAVPLGDGLVERLNRRPKDEAHIIVVACENVSENTDYLKSELLKRIPVNYHEMVEDFISFPNCVVDRIVPNAKQNESKVDNLKVFVEEYFQFVLDQNKLKTQLPSIEGFATSDNLDACLEQKLLTLNMGHAVVGYYGWLCGYKFVHEAMQDKRIQSLLLGAFKEVNDLITLRHKSISHEQQLQYSTKITARFANPYLQDEITRVARDPKRKLSPEDRLVKPTLLLWKEEKIPAYLSTGIAAALQYNNAGDEQARELTDEVKTKGFETVLNDISGLKPGDDLSRLVTSKIAFREL
ncbi:mannitol-1-phosphate 5-dehydrogenase [Candidatus Woesearchaeota archaeon]|nr:mannitol-1-phosphate 5-dehydrogenase [Candidatus Woesearchaeota archaeon]